MSGGEVLYIRSTKKDNGGSSGDDTSTNDDDVWDDTLLIDAYDKAIKLTEEEAKRRMQSSGPKEANPMSKKLWQVGDKCKCKYSEDNNYYEADVVDIMDSLGMCVVRYVGYENEEKVPLKKLLFSDGDTARALQIRDALNENENGNEMEVESENKVNFKEKLAAQFGTARKTSSKKKEKFKTNHEKSTFSAPSHAYHPSSFPGPPTMNSLIPPPPPPHLFANHSRDDSEAEAMSAMLMSWYMSGYHTGYYQGVKDAKKL